MAAKSKTPVLGHAPIPLRRVAGEDDVDQAGDFFWEVRPDGRRLLWLAVPVRLAVGDRRGVHSCAPVEVLLNEKKPGSWRWDGDEARPTLYPSLHAVGIWHGWVTKGQLIEHRPAG